MKKAFTLIELLIVVAIIAILAAIAVPNFLEAQVRSKVSRVHSDMRTLATALEAYYVDENNYPGISGHDPEDGEAYRYFAPWVFTAKGSGTAHAWLQGITTPIAYLSSFPDDPFYDFEENLWAATSGFAFSRVSYLYFNVTGARKFVQSGTNSLEDRSGSNNLDNLVQFGYVKFNGSGGKEYPVGWMLTSAGPDQSHHDPRLDDPETDLNIEMTFVNAAHFNHLIAGHAASYDTTNGTVSRGNIWRTSSGIVE